MTASNRRAKEKQQPNNSNNESLKTSPVNQLLTQKVTQKEASNTLQNANQPDVSVSESELNTEGETRKGLQCGRVSLKPVGSQAQKAELRVASKENICPTLEGSKSVCSREAKNQRTKAVAKSAPKRSTQVEKVLDKKRATKPKTVNKVEDDGDEWSKAEIEALRSAMNQIPIGVGK